MDGAIQIIQKNNGDKMLGCYQNVGESEGVVYFLLFCCMARIWTIRTKMLMKSSSSEMASLTGSRLIRPRSLRRAWWRTF